MDSKSFYKTSCRLVTHATTMSEVRNLVETLERLQRVVLLPPVAGDGCEQVIMKKYLKTLKRFLNLPVSSKWKKIWIM